MTFADGKRIRLQIKIWMNGRIGNERDREREKNMGMSKVEILKDRERKKGKMQNGQKRRMNERQ